MKKKYFWLSLALLLAAACAAAALRVPDILAEKGRQQAYQEGVLLQDRGDYTSAIVKYQESGLLDDSARRITECRYQMIVKRYNDGLYGETLPEFKKLGGYKDSKTYVMKCSYALAQAALEEKDYPAAIDYYLGSGDLSENLTQELDQCYYAYGHELFRKGELEAAHEFFEKLTCTQEDLGGRHFDTLEDSKEYVMECGLNAQEDIFYYIGDMETVPIMEVKKLVRIAQTVLGDANVSGLDNSVHVTLTPYPGVRIVAAHRSGELDKLCKREKDTYDMAVRIVDQAKAETSDALSLETWINDWICEHTEYDDDFTAYETVSGMPENCTAVGVLLNGKALCQGYTDAFYLLGTMAGLDVRYQSGFGGGGSSPWGGHIWNLIRFEDRWYNIDCTWNDSGEGLPTIHLYQNFLKEKGHVATEGTVLTLAEQVAPEDDYYMANNCDFNTVAEAAEEIVSRHFAEGEDWFEVRVRSTEVTENQLGRTIYKKMIQKGRYGVCMVGGTQSGETTVFVVKWG